MTTRVQRLSVFRALAVLAGLAVPGLALAHPGHGGVLAGVAHPLTGADHLLALVAAGLWAALCASGAPRRVALALAGGLVLGFVLARAGWVPPVLEGGIAASVLALGLLLAAAARWPVAVGAALVGSFALLHGAAHGVEAPAPALSGPGAGYALGVIVTSLAVYAGALAAGTRLRSHPRWLRLAGADTAVPGAWLLPGV